MNQLTKDDFQKHRDKKQLENLKYNMNRAQKSESETNNAADHVISDKEMTKNHSFVKSVKHINGVHFPLVTLYTANSGYKKICCKKVVAFFALIKKHLTLVNFM